MSAQLTLVRPFARFQLRLPDPEFPALGWTRTELPSFDTREDAREYLAWWSMPPEVADFFINDTDEVRL